VPTFGDLVTFNPHIHVLVAAGGRLRQRPHVLREARAAVAYAWISEASTLSIQALGDPAVAGKPVRAGSY